MTSNKAQEKRELNLAVLQLSNRGLLHSAKWVAELLSCYSDVEISSDSPIDYALKGEDSSDRYLLGKSYFDLKEYQRCANVLRDETNMQSVFLKNYALYLAGEKRKYEEFQEVGADKERHTVYNKELKYIKKELGSLYKAKKLDGFGTYLFGIVIGQTEDFRFESQLDFESDGEINQRNVYIDAIKKYPWNWASWLDLTTTLKDSSMIQRVLKELPEHIFKPFWTAHAYLEMQLFDHALGIYQLLSESYPTSNYIKAQTAVSAYLAKDFNLSYDLFNNLQRTDPFRTEDMDTFSNLLYIRDDASDLSYLAHKMTSIEKYSVETCCVIGNYYSIKRDHEKALIYFERALKLNPRHLNAWLLSGQEYLEMKNVAAANAAFRKAVDINNRDYRAWYNLAHTYDLLKLHQYALYYYSKACELSKNDPKVWEAMGDCYMETNQESNAEMCFKRAESIKQTKLGKE